MYGGCVSIYVFLFEKQNTKISIGFEYRQKKNRTLIDWILSLFFFLNFNTALMDLEIDVRELGRTN